MVAVAQLLRNVSHITSPMSADEYYVETAGRPHTELINGEVIVNTPNLQHQRIVGRILYAVETWIRGGVGRGEVLPEVDTPLNDRNVFAPDVHWVAEDHRPPTDAVRMPRPADLIVEIRSPSTWRYDIGLKFSRWEAAGVPELWLVDTESKSVLVYQRTKPAATAFDIADEFTTDAVITSPQLPGFELSVAEIFGH